MFLQKHRQNIASLRKKHNVLHDVLGFGKKFKQSLKSGQKWVNKYLLPPLPPSPLFQPLSLLSQCPTHQTHQTVKETCGLWKESEYVCPQLTFSLVLLHKNLDMFA